MMKKVLLDPDGIEVMVSDQDSFDLVRILGHNLCSIIQSSQI